MKRGRVAWLAGWSWILWAGFAVGPAAAQPFTDGEVFAALPEGKIARFDARGRPRGSLYAPSGGQMTGMCFDVENRLYATDFSNRVVARFGTDGRLDDRSWARGFDGNPESCVVDGDGNVYVGTVEPARALYKFDASGSLLEVFHPQPKGNRGMDWIDLAADQCTLFYTSEGPAVGRFDVCTGTQEQDLAHLGGHCFALRVREKGEVMVACGTIVYRLSKRGRIVQRYELPDESLFGLNLDRDGQHFWTGSIGSANVFRINIPSGRGTSAPFFNAAGLEPEPEEEDEPPQSFGDLFKQALKGLGKAIEELAAGERMGGLAVYGERIAAIEEKRSMVAAAPPEPAASAVAETDPWGGAVTRPPDDAATSGASVITDPTSAALEEPESGGSMTEIQPEVETEPVQTSPPSPPPPPPPPDGVLTLGEASAVTFSAVGSESEVETALALEGLEVRGRAIVRLSTDLDLDRVALELHDGHDWRRLDGEGFNLEVLEGGRASWPLRLVTRECPEAPAADRGYAVLVESEAASGGLAELRLPLELEVVADPWLHCWWPVLAVAAGLVLTGIGFHGFLSPSRFAPRAALILSPEEDLTEGFAHPLRAQRGSGSGFYRDARLYLFGDFRFASRAGGAWLRLRAEGQRVRIKPVGGTVYRQAADGEWEMLDEGETTLRPGVPHRDELETIFFEYRQS